MNALEMLETLVNLHDGVADGGGGILESDWAEARSVLEAHYQRVDIPAESIINPGDV